MIIIKRININNEINGTIQGRCELVYQEKSYLHTKLFYRLFKRFVEYNNLKKQLFNYHCTTVLLMDNFEAYKSNKVLELEAKNNIHLMFIKSHTSHLFKQEDSYTF